MRVRCDRRVLIRRSRLRRHPLHPSARPHLQGDPVRLRRRVDGLRSPRQLDRRAAEPLGDGRAVVEPRLGRSSRARIRAAPATGLGYLPRGPPLVDTNHWRQSSAASSAGLTFPALPWCGSLHRSTGTRPKFAVSGCSAATSGSAGASAPSSTRAPSSAVSSTAMLDPLAALGSRRYRVRSNSSRESSGKSSSSPRASPGRSPGSVPELPSSTTSGQCSSRRSSPDTSGASTVTVRPGSVWTSAGATTARRPNASFHGQRPSTRW